MRDVTLKSTAALKGLRNFKRDNTQVEVGSGFSNLYLHGNNIASYYTGGIGDDILILSDCGRKTKTTKERLNWVLDAFNMGYIYQKDYTWYYVNPQGEEIVFPWVLKLEIVGNGPDLSKAGLDVKNGVLVKA